MIREKEINLREAAVDILLQVEKGAYSHVALGEFLEKNEGLESRDRAFVVRLTEGTLERQMTLDYFLEQYASVGVRKMKPLVRTILRTALYQILYMDRVPDHAACNEAVSLAGHRGLAALKPFVNGVLRKMTRERENLAYPEEGQRDVFLSVKFSLPLWVVRQWINDYGAEYTEIMAEALLREGDVTARCTENQGDMKALMDSLRAQGLTVRRDDRLPYVLHMEHVGNLTGLRAFQEGLFYIQDISSMRVAEMAEVRENDVVLDLCAAPGGKALHIAEKLRGTGYVEARDVSSGKVGLMNENIRRMGLKNIKTLCRDARQKDPVWRERADIVLADLPCSGLGTLGKKPDIKYRMSPEKIEDLVRLQRDILGIAGTYVKPKGKLIYSTCTVSRRENEENRSWFLTEHPGFSLVREKQFFPGIDEGDGFYIALFQKGEIIEAG